MKRRFHLGDVLSITTGRLVSPRHMDGVYDILNFMTGDNLFTHQLPRACDECKPYLLKQFPQLNTAFIQSACRTLDREVENRDSRDPENGEPMPLNITAWLEELTTRYGEYLEVETIPKEAHEKKNPLAEMQEMAPNAKLIGVCVDSS